jgi:hypothetical protein
MPKLGCPIKFGFIASCRRAVPVTFIQEHSSRNKTPLSCPFLFSLHVNIKILLFGSKCCVPVVSAVFDQTFQFVKIKLYECDFMLVGSIIKKMYYF